MLNNIFQGIFDTEMTNVISLSDFLLCVGSALIIGLFLAACSASPTTLLSTMQGKKKK